MEFRQVQCPNCGSPAGIDDNHCGYCFARIPAQTGGEGANAVVVVAFAFVLGLLAADWYLGIGITEWISGAGKG